MRQTAHPDPPRARREARLPWLLAVAFAFLAGMLFTSRPDSLLQSAQAQSAAAGARGVYAFTGPLDSSRTGLFMLDIEQGTVWVYEIETVDTVRKLKLVAARSWVYDRYLRDFNCAAPTFRDVQDLVSRQREREAQDDARARSQEPVAPEKLFAPEKPDDKP